MTQAIWRLRGETSSDIPKETVEACGGSPVLAKLLVQRGIKTPADIQTFLDLEHYSPTSGMELPDMAPALARILKAIDHNEPILIFGDFDVDGITGTSVLYETLRFLNATVSYYIPDRATEGHGLNVAALCKLVSTRKVKVVITTDTGITNFSEVSLLNGLGVDTIVTDHHEMPEHLPPGLANVNPKRLEDPDHPLAFMAGVGVAFKLCEQLLREKNAPISFIESLLDLVAIGTVADLAPLHRENRYLVYRGIQVLNQRQRLGIQEILTNAGTRPEATLTSETVGFTIGPRLNALGRLDNATEAVELLTTTDPERARIIAAHLEHLNRRRQELCEQTMVEAEKHLLTSGGLDGRKTIVLGSPDWNLGIIGIVASRLIEKYHVPVFLMVIDESKGEVRCSARSIPSFDLHGALSTMTHYFSHFGGHSGAAGFGMKLEHLEAFKRDIYALTNSQITEKDMLPIIEMDARLEWSQLSPHLVNLVNQLAPFGKDNPAPLFLLENVQVAAQRAIGTDGRHLKLILTGKDPKQPIEGLFWNFGTRDKFNPSHRYHFVVAPELNHFNNQTKLQLILQDYRSAETTVKLAREVSTETTTQPPLPLEGASSSTSSNPIWIDHRSRESLDSFLGQLMLPLQDQQPIQFFHEGKTPDIPFLDPAILCTRYTTSPSETLILWDLPPDLLTLQKVLQTVQPKTLHLLGGKYQSVPLFPAPRDYLKLLYQRLAKTQQVAGDTSPLTVNVAQWASHLATTHEVVTHGLLVLSRLKMIDVQVGASATPEDIVGVHIQSPPPSQTDEAIYQSLEYIAFQRSLKAVGRFRSWLLQAPLDQIKSSAIVELFEVSEEEAHPHGTVAHHVS